VSLAIDDDASDDRQFSRSAADTRRGHPERRRVRHETVEEGFRGFVARTLGDEGREWIAQLPSVYAELAGRWRLVLAPELPGGLLSSVRAVSLEDGSQAILKIGSSTRTHDEIEALRAWGGGGAPMLLAADIELRAMLLERIEPGGHPVGAPGVAVAAVLRQLHVPPHAGLPMLTAIVPERIEHAVRDRRASEQKASWALAKTAELARDAPTPVLLHGDFDERNLLVCSRRGICAIDPLPCAGDPAYDAAYWVHGNRRRGRRARLDAVVAATGLDRGRIRDWAAIVGVHG
jgi:streptomycin 6-kinase